MNSYKKIISFVLLLLVAAPIIIFSVIIIKQKIVQEQMQEALEQDMLQTIAVSKADVQWEEEGKEVVINGAMFDVKSYSIKEDKIILIGLYDMQETDLKQQVEKLQQQKNKSDSPTESVVLKLMLTTAILPTPIYVNFYATITSSKFLNYSESVVIQNCTVISPPPII